MRSLRVLGCVQIMTTVVAGQARETGLSASQLSPASGAGSSRAATPTSASLWEPSVTAKLGGGYKDNAALSQAKPEGSAFLRTSIDATAVRLPVDGWQATVLLLGDDTRYFSSRTVDHEDLVFGQAEVRKFWLNDWQAAFSLESAFVDQVIDLSVTETNQARLIVRGGTLVARPSVRRELSESSWLAWESPATRQMFDGLPDDYWFWAPRLTLGRTYGHGSELWAAYEFGYRHYDTDPPRQADRTAITNRARVTVQQEIQGAWKHHWDAERRWRTVTKVAWRWSDDSRGNYFGYRRGQVSEQVRVRLGPWEWSAEARLAWYRFSQQKGSNGRDDRARTDLGVTARVERGFGRRWRVFAEYEHAVTDSNLRLEEYAANTGWAGVEVEF